MNLSLTAAMQKQAQAAGLLRSCPECGRKFKVAPAAKAGPAKCPECGTVTHPAPPKR